ncbi:acyltransferase [Allocoleopsis sp.]|uniref:acyltransferase n=1 Tax=Allocoleopsis sp. TaxID=3088169 RepID=UPI002FCEB679
MSFLSKYISSLHKRFKYRIYLYIKSLLEFGESLKRQQIFDHHANIHSSVKVLPNATVENLSGNPELIKIGENSVIRGQLRVFPHAGKIQIGKDCYVGEDTRIWSADSITIGNRVFISHNVNIHDTNSHSIDQAFRYKHFVALMSNDNLQANDFDIESKFINIEDDVWIGFNSTILKGVTIGKGSVVGACSVVTKNVPPLVIVAGNPARVVKAVELKT